MYMINSNEDKNQVTTLTTESDDNMEVDQEQFDGSPWAEIPSPVVEKIYSYLNRKDRQSMSIVCRKWYQEYNSPSLWRRIRFCLSGDENNIEVCNSDIKLVEKYGAMLHHLEIIFDKNCRRQQILRQNDTILRLLKLCMEVVAHYSRLRSIFFTDMEHYFECLEDEPYEDLFRNILNFYKSQTRLECVEFSKSKFKTAAEAAEILKITLTNNSKTLKHMILPGFLSQPGNELTEMSVDDCINFDTLMNLQVWKMDFTRTFVNMILSFYEYRNKGDLRERKGHLKKLELFCDCDRAVNNLRIRPVVWEYLRNVFPNLIVNLSFQSTVEPSNIDKFIVAHMPVRAVVFVCDLSVWSVNIGSLLHHITSCDINMSLQMLKIVSLQHSSNLAPDLISFTKVCPNLKILELYLKYPVESLDTVFNSWLENRPMSLDIVHITILDVRTRGGRKLYAELNDFYGPLLHSLGLSLLMVAN